MWSHCSQIDVEDVSSERIKTWDDLSIEIDAKISSPTSTATMKRQIRRIQTLPRVLALLTHTFATSVIPYAVEFDVIWGLIYLTLKVRSTTYFAEDVSLTFTAVIHITSGAEKNYRCSR